MKLRIEIEGDIEDTAARATGPLMRILKIMSGEVPYQVKWYQDNRERILTEDKERRRVIAEQKKVDEPPKKVMTKEEKQAERAAYERLRRAKRRAERARDKAQAKTSTTEHVTLPVPPTDFVLRFDNT